MIYRCCSLPDLINVLLPILIRRHEPQNQKLIYIFLGNRIRVQYQWEKLAPTLMGNYHIQARVCYLVEGFKCTTTDFGRHVVVDRHT